MYCAKHSISSDIWQEYLQWSGIWSKKNHPKLMGSMWPHKPINLFNSENFEKLIGIQWVQLNIKNYNILWKHYTLLLYWIKDTIYHMATLYWNAYNQSLLIILDKISICFQLWILIQDSGVNTFSLWGRHQCTAMFSV